MLRTASRRRSGFSLVELLVVVAIVAILGGMMIPSISSMMRSYQLDSSAQSVLNMLTVARQTAQTRGYGVQVRLYQLPDYSQSGTSTPTVYRGIQAFLESDPTASGGVTVTPITRPYFFQTGVVVLNDSTKSTLLTLNSGTPKTNDPLNPLPGYGANYNYQVFRYLPSGQTDLTSAQTILNLVIENAPLKSTGLPSNFMTIQIDPTNGYVRSFRP